MRSEFYGSSKTGCPTLAASLFLRLGWDTAIAFQGVWVGANERSVS
jgi:hypothetical protein